MNLHIAADLDLPADAVTQAFAIVARRGAGKTTTARSTMILPFDQKLTPLLSVK